MILNMGGGGVNLGETTASASDIRKGKTAGIKTGIVAGTMGEVRGETITPGTVERVIDGNQFLLGDIVIVGDENLIPENIPEGVTLFDVQGEKNVPQYGILMNDVNSDGYPTKITIRFDYEALTSNSSSIFYMYYLNQAKNLVESCEEITVDIPGSYGSLTMDKFFTNFGGKLKIKRATSLGHKTISYFAKQATSGKMSIYLANTIQTIPSTTNDYSPFRYANDSTQIYCEHESKPSEFGTYWNYGSDSYLTAMWGVKEYQFDAL